MMRNTYIVKSGDSLWKIASTYQVGLQELISANPQISNPNLIYVGQQINIPSKNGYVSMEEEIINLVNQERKKNNLNPLIKNWQLSRTARIKSEDMATNNYFSHTSPTYGSPFNMLTDFNIKYQAAAENIAYGQTSAEEVMNSWMNSSGHRANILNPNYNQIGVGVARNNKGVYYFTQQFIKN